MTQYINPQHLDNTHDDAESFLNTFHNTVVATAIASYAAGQAATRVDIDLMSPNFATEDQNYNISIVGNASSNYAIEVKNCELYYTGLATFTNITYTNGVPSTIYSTGGLPTKACPLIATYLAMSNNVGAAGFMQDSHTITGMYMGVTPVGSYGARLTITNPAIVGGETLYITVRRF